MKVTQEHDKSISRILDKSSNDNITPERISIINLANNQDLQLTKNTSIEKCLDMLNKLNPNQGKITNDFTNTESPLMKIAQRLSKESEETKEDCQDDFELRIKRPSVNNKQDASAKYTNCSLTCPDNENMAE